MTEQANWKLRAAHEACQKFDTSIVGDISAALAADDDKAALAALARARGALVHIEGFVYEAFPEYMAKEEYVDPRTNFKRKLPPDITRRVESLLESWTAGPDLDRAVGAWVYGQMASITHPDLGEHLTRGFNVPDAMSSFGWSPSTNMRHAWPIALVFRMSLSPNVDGSYTAHPGTSVLGYDESKMDMVESFSLGFELESRAATAELAICHAAVRASAHKRYLEKQKEEAGA